MSDLNGVAAAAASLMITSFTRDIPHALSDGWLSSALACKSFQRSCNQITSPTENDESLYLERNTQMLEDSLKYAAIASAILVSDPVSNILESPAVRIA